MLKCVVCGKEAEYVHVHSYCKECFEERKQSLQHLQETQRKTFLSRLDGFLWRPSVKYGNLGLIAFICIVEYLRGDLLCTILFLVLAGLWIMCIIGDDGGESG